MALDYLQRLDAMLTGTIVTSVCKGLICSVGEAASSGMELVDCDRERCRCCVGDVGRGMVEAIRSWSSLCSLVLTAGKLSVAVVTCGAVAAVDLMRS